MVRLFFLLQTGPNSFNHGDRYWPPPPLVPYMRLYPSNDSSTRGMDVTGSGNPNDTCQLQMAAILNFTVPDARGTL